MFGNLFVAKKRLYVQNVKGKIRKIKWVLTTIFLSIYVFSPFLIFDRPGDAPDQAILIDFAQRKAYFFFIEIWPQEVFYLAGILIIAAVMLFFVTSLFGRVWCGYGCFQTVWTDIFIAIERLFQGDRNQRIILDRKNNFKKYFSKFLTHLTWIIIALFTGFCFVAYFNDSYQLVADLFALNLSFNVLGWILGIAFMTYLMGGFAREHVCTFMCPYSRFQSAMFDDNTLVIAYDEKRGEPRAKAKAGTDFSNRGHCIDCKQCVVVCPTGIDIRNGLQMECIACGLCIDACDNVMEKMNLPKGLIRYDTLNHLKNPTAKTKFRPFRFRTYFYLAILTLVCSLMLKSLVMKPNVETTMLHDRNPTFVMLSDGSIRNGYSLKIINKTHGPKKFSFKILQPKEVKLDGQNCLLENLEVGPQEVKTFRIFATLDEKLASKNSEGRFLVRFLVTDLDDGSNYEEESMFIVR